ncbi:putative autophagy protein [Kockovaella imperatae]|uniref:Autophagy-related protein n=1 Tax=Kockovaella imperatae TaxID=4999 RepID=A0A1Y1UNV9_9TREE|nr:putative autophagy protein [Kockovaella imperatae]ORX39156.1 putative autophagy protein [Kockovaella imperatae]
MGSQHNHDGAIRKTTSLVHLEDVAEEQTEIAERDEDRRCGEQDISSDAAKAVIVQNDLIESEAKRVPTSSKEYWCYCVFCFAQLGTGIGTDGGALRQALTSLAWPTGTIRWGRHEIPLNVFLLDLNGLLYLIQMIVLLVLGSYADYGRWRYWLLMSFDAVLICCMLGLSTLKQAASWRIAQLLWMIGCLSSNILGTFFNASFPELVRNLPRVQASENAVRSGQKSPEDHAEMDMLERATLYNWVNTIGSASVVTASSIAVCLSQALGTGKEQLITTYRVLLAYFAAMTLLFSLPYLVTSKRRPGAKMPKGSRWWSLGPKQIYLAAKHLRYLRQCFLYLLAYFLLCEAFGTSGGLVSIVQNEVLDYSPGAINTLAMLSNISGGTGTFACLLAQKRWRFTIKQGVCYGAFMACLPIMWGAIGLYTSKIGFHNTWEFWILPFWNFHTAAWGSYNISMITEVVPAPKMFLFFALFSAVGKTSGFIGPLVTSYIIEAAGGNTNVAFVFLTGVGLLGVYFLSCVDTDQAKIDNAEFLRREEMGFAEERETETSPLLQS